ncbi:MULTISPECIES: DUF536 domain-containing protein [unclassified Streptococcus]|uniref:DUF536 domain-containing protein n=1 Tax=unclassified Streptococcus TaxID=2608887 RepID=UPI0018AB8EBA|nr:MULTISPECIES: DUF536 domain-containing protein [unclassified Streptococcus]MBF8971007.1 DUF536 domain-containing protein [Streptococcus sp. NLN76]MBG9368105.1 DUF536 domain-containing protein [Streptococcus sp. NLN64]MBJ6746457.1 DUF536 domain-containing protein [Streptococcus sp. 121]
MAIEKTVSELAEILGISRQAVNTRVKTLPPEDLSKNEKGVTVVTRSGLIKLEGIYKKSIFEDEPISEDAKQREILQILVDEKNEEITRQEREIERLHEQLKSKDEQLRTKDSQIAEKDKQLDQQQQLTLQAMNDKDTLKLELDAAKKQVEEQQTRKGFWSRLFGN